jgi:hypothetical protein
MKIVNKNIAIVTSSLTAPGATMLQQAFAARGQTADIVLLGDGYSVAGRIDASDIVILRMGPKSFAIYQDTVLPNLENVKHKKLLTRMLRLLIRVFKLKSYAIDMCLCQRPVLFMTYLSLAHGCRVFLNSLPAIKETVFF